MAAPTFANSGVNAAPDFSVGSGTSHTTPTWTPPDGLNFAGIHSRHGSGPVEPTMSGNGLTWVNVGSVMTGTLHRLTLFVAVASGATAGGTTVSFGAQDQVWMTGTFFYSPDADVSGGAAAALVQVVTGSHNGANVGSLSIGLAAASHADNRPVAVFWKNHAEAFAPRASWTELDDLTVTGARRIQSQYRGDAFETTASGHVTATNTSIWLGIAAEVKAAGGGGPTGQPTMMRWSGVPGMRLGSRVGGW